MSLLAAHPSIGFSASIGAAILPYINALEPIFSLIGLMIGLAIGLVTLRIKLIELRRKRKNVKK